MSSESKSANSFKNTFSLYENGFKNRFKNNNDTNRDLLLCGSLPDLLRIIPKGHVSEVRNRFQLCATSPPLIPSSSSPSCRRRRANHGKQRVDEESLLLLTKPSAASSTTTTHRCTPYAPAALTNSNFSASDDDSSAPATKKKTPSTYSTPQSYSFLRREEGCSSSPERGKAVNSSSSSIVLPILVQHSSNYTKSTPDLTVRHGDLKHSSSSSCANPQNSSAVKLRYRTSIRIMVRPDKCLHTRAESVERSDMSKRKTSSSKLGHGMLKGSPSSTRPIVVKEQFRLPRDCSEKMPSASNSPLMTRKTYHRPHHSHLASDPPTVGPEDIDEVSKEILRKISHHQQLSVASMVRRFETREDIKTRAGVKSPNEEEDPSPKVSSCSSMSSSVGGLRSPDIDEEADLSSTEKENEQQERAPSSVLPGSASSPSKSNGSNVRKESKALPSSNPKKPPSISSKPSAVKSPGYGAVPKAKPPSTQAASEPPSELSSKKKSLVPKKKPVTSKSSSSSSFKKAAVPSPTSSSSSKQSEEPRRSSGAVANVLRAVNKRSESDGIVLAERPKPEKTVRRCESVDDAVASISDDPFPTGSSSSFSSTPCPATIIKGPEDAIKTLGGTVDFSVHYFGDPDPGIVWSKNGKPLTGPRVSIVFSNGTSTLSLKNLIGEDGGKYECSVSNESGSDVTSASLSVPTPPEPPAGRPFVSDIDFGAKCLTLAWYGSTFDGGSIVTGYRVEMSSWPISSEPEPPETEDWKVLTSDINSTSYIFKELLPGREYIFRIRCENVVGLSEPSLPSEPVRCQVEDDQEEEEDGSSEEGEDEEEDTQSFEAPFQHRIVSLDEGSVFKRKYGVYDELGRGRFGVVFKVKDKETNEILAAKFVKCRRSEDRQKVRDEIDIMNSLDYGKLLQLAAAYENPKEIIMVMEYIGGGELFEKVVQDDFTLTELDCVLFMKQICAAVGYMHSKDIVHLDLKPENILCKSKKSHQIKIIDFGLTRKLKPPDEVRILFGTPEFVSPEVINYEPVSTTSDMWSVGVVCYVLLSGLSPFMGDSDAETFGNISGIRYDFEDEAFDNISEEAKDFISNLLVKNQNERLSAEDCLLHPWLAAEKTAAVKTINTEKLKSFLMRRKWQKAAHAIRALGRFTSLGFRGDGKGSSSSISGFSTQSADF